MKTLPTPEEVRGLYEQLTESATPISPGTYKGEWQVLKDGTRIGYRRDSKFGGPTTEIWYPSGEKADVHLPEPPKTPQLGAADAPTRGNAGVPEAIAEGSAAPSSPPSSFPDWGTHIPPGELAKSDDPILGNLGQIIDAFTPPDPNDPKNTA